MTKKKSGKRFRLLIYERMWQRWASTCILIILGSITLRVFAPRITFFPPSLRTLTLVPAIACLAILIYAYLARRLAWVQCRSGHLRIQTPLYPLAISYARIKGVRPNTVVQVFNPAELKSAQRNWLRPYLGMTAVVVELAKYPVRKEWLRLWFSPFLLFPRATSFVLLVDDWMTLSRQLDDFRSNWEMRRAAQRQELQAGQSR